MNKKTMLVYILICIAIVVLASAFASSHPDGLEWVASRLGFIGTAVEEDVIASPMPDYSILPIKSPFWSTFLAGSIGIALTFFVFWLAGSILKRR